MNIAHTGNCRDMDTDLMRVIAAFFVVLLHLSGLHTPVSVIYNAVSRFSVPVFVMISGYYMLDHKRDVFVPWKKCGKFLAQMVVWSAGYFLFGLLCGTQSFDGNGALVTWLLTEPVHLWYVYALVGLYLLTPMLRVFAVYASQKEYVYALVLTFLLGSVLVILLRWNIVPMLAVIAEKSKLPYTLGFVCLYLLGGYLKRYPVRHPGWICAAGLAGLLVTACGTLLLGGELLLSFFAPNVMVMALAFFVLVRHLCRLRPVPALAWLHEAAACTFGVYLLHPMAIQVFQGLPWTAGLFAASDIWNPVRALVVLAACSLCIAALRRIPVLSWLVR